MSQVPFCCLILGCGNALRGDDGVGLWLARWAEERFRAEPAVRVVLQQQWTPELAEDIAHADSVLFIDCSVDSAPGQVRLRPVGTTATGLEHGTHHLGACELLALAHELYGFRPRAALLLTMSAGSLDLGEELSGAVQAALPRACFMLEDAVLRLLAGTLQGASE